jgi:hypothetical protein
MFSKYLTLFLTLFSFGSASAESLYVLIPPTSSSKIDCWAEHFQKFDTIVGYSNLGHFFLRASSDNQYIVLHPLKKAAKSYGVFESVLAFENTILKEPGFSIYVLRSEHIALIQKRIGPLKNDEVYIPVPYPFIGGSDKPETYSKGNVWVFMNIVSQMQGLCG